MHAVFFGIKRVHLRTLQLSRGMLEEHALTPARFDMMRIVEMHVHGIPQRNIQYYLGVSAPTVSRMLRALELLGMVVRKRLERDKRNLIVAITNVGRNIVEIARETLVESGIAEQFALRGLGSDPEIARADLTTLKKFLSRIRRRYGDPSPFEHPWRVGDLVPLYMAVMVDGRFTGESVALP